jgi:hypothetical protein
MRLSSSRALHPMNKFVTSELQRLNEDFEHITGGRFGHFFCPILYQDANVPLSRAHIINEAFDDSAPDCTVQRSDVDSFYGSRFEADFVDTAKFRRISLTEILTDSALAKRFNARVLLDAKQVEHFYPNGDVPEQFARVQVGNVDPSRPFGLKMQKSEVINAAHGNWEIEVWRDVTVHMLVSAIKAAHLSLFKMLGYRYVFTPSGYFVGRMLLGEFFLQNSEVRKKNILDRAIDFFAPNVHMVRPVVSTTLGAEGTITDRIMFMCMGGSGNPWAFIVLVKTDEQMHGVMIPTFQTPDQVDTSLGFTRNSNTSLQVATCRFQGDEWYRSEGTMPMTWPKDGCLLTKPKRSSD